MTLNQIALESFRKQSGRKFFLMAAVILGTATVITLYNFISVQKHSIEKQFDEYGANIIIQPAVNKLSLSYGGINVGGVMTDYNELSMDRIKNIWAIENNANIRAVSPKLLISAPVQSGSNYAETIIAGVDFESELKIKNWWEVEGKIPSGKNEIIAGSDAAVLLDLTPGGKIKIKNNIFTVAGILQPTGSQDDQIILADYKYAAGLFNKNGKATIVEVSALCADCPIETLISQISRVMPGAKVSGIKQVMQQKMQAIAQFETFAFSITIIISIIGAILIFTSMMGSVAERKKEIGIFRAIGYEKSHIIRIILMESTFLSLISGAAGIITGILISFIIIPASANPGPDLIRTGIVFYLSAIAAVGIITILSTLYPAIKASNTDPAIALRSL